MGYHDSAAGTALAVREADQAAGDELAWLWPPFFMLRLGGMPATSVAPLRFVESIAWAERVLDSERELRRDKDELADALQETVAGLDVGAVRRKLLELRRDVFNLRLPRDIDQARAVAATLDRAVGRRLLGWLDTRQRHEELIGLGEQVMAEETVRRREHLRELVRHPHIRHGLLLASSSLDRYLRTYLDAPADKLSKRARRIERSALEYIYRTACKTSPFSSFTAVGLGRFADGGGSLLALDSVPPDWHSHTRLNLAVVGRLMDLLMTQPVLRADLPLRVTPGWREDRDRIRYVRRQQISGDSEAAVTLDRVQENLFYLASSAVLDELFEILPDGRQLRFAELSERLGDSPGESRTREQVDSYLGHLIRLGLLVVPTLHVDIHHPDPLRAFGDGIRGLDRQWASGLADRIGSIADLVSEYRTASLTDRRVLLDDIRLEIGDAQHELGATESTVPRTLIYEDVSIPVSPVADRREWDERLKPELTGLASILPVFDLTLPQRLVTRGFFRARYGDGGRCDDVVRFVHEFHQDFYEQYLRSGMQRRDFDEDGEYVDQPNWLQQPEIEALDNARRTLVDEMRQRYAAHPGDDVELVLDDEFIDKVAAHLPISFGDLDPHCFFLQIGRDDGAGGEPFAVLNRAYSGLTLQFSRFAHCFGEQRDGLADGLRATLAEVCPSGAVFAELKGGYETSNLNLHPAVTPYELVCPGDLSFRPEAEQIHVDDLYIVDDDRGGRLRLRSRRLDVEVIPVYLGFLVPLALPEIQRLLLNFSYTSMARIDLWSGVDRPLEGKTIGGHPRVRYGNLVITRRLWKCHPEYLLRRGRETDAEALLAWTRWRRDNGLPPRVFVTPDVSGMGDPQEDPGGRPAMASTMKPQFVDFESQFSLSLLEHIVKSATQRLVFTEMLPDLSQAWLHPDGEPYVSELTVELDGVRRRS